MQAHAVFLERTLAICRAAGIPFPVAGDPGRDDGEDEAAWPVPEIVR
jgi:hypothetical protein